jgi:hypothetical protein
LGTPKTARHDPPDPTKSIGDNSLKHIRAVLVHRRAEHHVVGFLAHEPQAEPVFHTLSNQVGASST